MVITDFVYTGTEIEHVTLTKNPSLVGGGFGLKAY